MARYFFDMIDGKRTIRDALGCDLPDVEAARTEALEALPEIARGELPPSGQYDLTTHVRDHTGAVIFVATLSITGKWVNQSAANDLLDNWPLKRPGVAPARDGADLLDASRVSSGGTASMASA